MKLNVTATPLQLFGNTPWSVNQSTGTVPRVITQTEQQTGLTDVQQTSTEIEQDPLLPKGMTKEEVIHRVVEYFPTYKPDSILRFSSLIKPNSSSLPNVWKDCKKRKLRPPEERIKPEDWTLKFGPVPGPDMIDDQEERFLTPVAVDDHGQKENSKQNLMIDDEIREWRFGPAKMWYDMFNIPEDGSGFDYGFKLKVCAMILLRGVTVEDNSS